MKITSNLTHVATEIEFEAPLNEEELLAVFEKSGVQGFPAELDIAERTEDHVQMMSLDGLLGFAKASGLSAVTYDVTYFPHADDASAEAIGVEKEDVVMAIESNFSVEYLQGVIHEEEGSPICLIDKISQKGEAEEDKVVDNILLKEVLGKLDKRERQIIMLRYFEDKTQSEIGELLNISQVQVSRIEKKVLHKLKSYIEM